MGYLGAALFVVPEGAEGQAAREHTFPVDAFLDRQAEDLVISAMVLRRGAVD